MTQHRTLAMEATTNNESTKQNLRLSKDNSLSDLGEGGGGLNAFYWYQISA